MHGARQSFFIHLYEEAFCQMYKADSIKGGRRQYQMIMGKRDRDSETRRERERERTRTRTRIVYCTSAIGHYTNKGVGVGGGGGAWNQAR